MGGRKCVYFQDTGLPGRDNEEAARTHTHTHIQKDRGEHKLIYSTHTREQREQSVTQPLSSCSHAEEARAPEVNTQTRLAPTHPLCRPLCRLIFSPVEVHFLCVCVRLYDLLCKRYPLPSVFKGQLQFHFQFFNLDPIVPCPI